MDNFEPVREPLVEEVNPEAIQDPFFTEYRQMRDRENAWHRNRRATDELVRQRECERSRNSYYLHREKRLSYQSRYAVEHKGANNAKSKRAYAKAKKLKTECYYHHLHAQEIYNELKRDSGYDRVRVYLYRRGMKPPLNFTVNIWDRLVVWTMAHP